jgi:DNA polymerase epsilon subunit 2
VAAMNESGIQTSGARRRQVARACKKYGLLIQPAAMAKLLSIEHQMDYEEEFFDIDGLLRSLSAMLSQKGPGPKLITLPVLVSALEAHRNVAGGGDASVPTVSNNHHTINNLDSKNRTTSLRQGDNVVGDSRSQKVAVTIAPTRSWRLVSAFETPKLVYDAMRQQFRYDTNPSDSLMGTAKDLIEMRTQRYDMVRQRVVRYRQKNQLKPIMTIDRLLGSNALSSEEQARGDVSVEHVLLGMIRSNPSASTGCWLELEDMTGSIPLKVCLNGLKDKRPSNDNQIDDYGMDDAMTKIDSEGIYMDGSMVLVYGSYLENGTFLCRKITFPPLEKAVHTKEHLPPSPFENSVIVDESDTHRSTAHAKTSIYCLGGLELDDSDCLEKIKRVIKKMKADECGKEGESDVESILVLFGDFKTHTMRLSSALEEISKILKQSSLSGKSSILILPGPQDVSPNSCWPLPAIDRHCTPLSLREMDNVYMCSNPCRLEFCTGQSILLMRKDLIRESVQNQILTVTKESSISNTAPPPIDRRILHHMLSQGHIMPASTSATMHPIYWNFDHAMRLTPLPDLMLVGLDPDYTENGLEFVRADCRVLVPPSRENFDNLLHITLSNADGVSVSMGSDDEVEEN